MKIAAIARKEILEMRRDSRIRYGATVLFALLAVSFATGWKHYADGVKLRAAAQRIQRESWIEKGEMHPHMAAHY